jgi:hypothetical protein
MLALTFTLLVTILSSAIGEVTLTEQLVYSNATEITNSNLYVSIDTFTACINNQVLLFKTQNFTDETYNFTDIVQHDCELLVSDHNNIFVSSDDNLYNLYVNTSSSLVNAQSFDYSNSTIKSLGPNTSGSRIPFCIDGIVVLFNTTEDGLLENMNVAFSESCQNVGFVRGAVEEYLVIQTNSTHLTIYGKDDNENSGEITFSFRQTVAMTSVVDLKVAFNSLFFVTDGSTVFVFEESGGTWSNTVNVTSQQPISQWTVGKNDGSVFLINGNVVSSYRTVAQEPVQYDVEYSFQTATAIRHLDSFDFETVFYMLDDGSVKKAHIDYWTYTPTINPTYSPTKSPTVSPTNNPTSSPTASPTNNPTKAPSKAPTPPTAMPTASPVEPTPFPTRGPTKSPTTPRPTNEPTRIDDGLETWEIVVIAISSVVGVTILIEVAMYVKNRY